MYKSFFKPFNPHPVEKERDIYYMCMCVYEHIYAWFIHHVYTYVHIYTFI